MNKLEYILRKADFGNWPMLVDFIYALDLPEAEPLQKLFKEAEGEEVEFPDGLSYDEFIHHIDGVYCVIMELRSSLLYRLSGIMERDHLKSGDMLYEYYTKDIHKFREKLEYTLSHKSEFIVLPEELNRNNSEKLNKASIIPPLPELPPL